MQHPCWCNSQYLLTFTVAHDMRLQLQRPQESVLCVIVNADRYYNISGYIYYLSSHAVLWME
jgi:hypothetical protein